MIETTNDERRRRERATIDAFERATRVRYDDDVSRTYRVRDAFDDRERTYARVANDRIATYERARRVEMSTRTS